MNRHEHLITIAMEECCELALAKRLSKASRFGLEQIQPGQELTNRERIQEEFDDLVGVMEMAGFAPTAEGIASKQRRVERYMHESLALGTLEGVPRGVPPAPREGQS